MLSEILHKIGFDFQLAFFHTINFLIVFFILVKFAFPKLQKAISERTKKIKAGLKNFEDSQELLNQSKISAQKIISEGESEKRQILESAEDLKKQKLKSVEESYFSILEKAKVDSEILKNESYNKGADLLQEKLPNIFQIITQKAFSDKVTPSIQAEFIKKVFQDEYGK
jgi:F-type H+-transporting ATPase subunit b